MPPVASANAVKDIASGIAITGGVFALSVVIPIIGFTVAVFIPLPVLFYRIRLGRRAGVVMVSLTAVFMLLVTGGAATDLWFFFGLLLIGFVLGELIERRTPVEFTVLVSAGAALCAGLVALLAAAAASGTGVGALVTKYVARNLELTLALYKSMGVSPENVALFARSMDRMTWFLVRIMPALAVASTLLIAWANLLLSRPLLSARRLPSAPDGTLNRWKAPEYLVWGLIGCGIAVAFTSGARACWDSTVC